MQPCTRYSVVSVKKISLGEKIMFNKKQTTITILFTIFSLLFVAVPMVGAADNYSFSYVQTPSSFSCSPNRVTSSDGVVSYSLPKNAKITTTEYLNGSQYASNTSSLGGNGKSGFPVVSSLFPTSQSYPYVYTVTYSVKVGGEKVSESTLSVKCTSATTATILVSSLDLADGVEGYVASPPDNRLNWGYGDSNVAVFYPDSTGIGVYIFNTELYIPNFVSEADVADYLENPPSENTLIASAGSVSAYVLTTGEISFIMTDNEGKNYALIMSDLSGNDAYGLSY